MEHSEQQRLSLPNPNSVWVTTLWLTAEEVGKDPWQVLAGAQHQPLHHGRDCGGCEPALGICKIKADY